MRIRPLRAIVGLAGLIALAACGVTGNLRFDPGYADFGSPGLRDTNRELALSLGPLPLKLARAIMADDPELAGILKSLRAVRVYIYEVDGNAERVNSKMRAAHGRLVERGWESVVAVRDDGGLVTALVRMDEPERMRGLVVIVQDDEEVVLVNLIGALEPEAFAFAMDELGVELPRVALVR